MPPDGGEHRVRVRAFIALVLCSSNSDSVLEVQCCYFYCFTSDAGKLQVFGITQANSTAVHDIHVWQHWCYVAIVTTVVTVVVAAYAVAGLDAVVRGGRPHGVSSSIEDRHAAVKANSCLHRVSPHA